MLFLQLFRESVLFAINSLRVNKLRTFLSLLGISIGIFTIITVFTIVDSFEASLKTSVAKLGNNVIYVQKWPWIFGGDYPWWKYFNRPSPSYKDYEELEKRVQNAEAMAFEIGIQEKTVKYKSNSAEEVYIAAVSHNYDQVRAMEFEKGRYFSQNESRSGRNYALIGYSVAKALFGDKDPVGKDIKVLGRKVTVIGVVQKEGDDILDNTADNCVFIPINYARNLVDTRSDRYNPFITVKAKSNTSLDELKNELQGAMRSIRKLSPREEDDFSLNQSSMLSIQLEAMFGVINVAGWIIGGFSILVGGFGIANIMFVSVKERTNIIGIQKSLGAKNYFILLQFLVEAVVLSVIGGMIGLGVVYIETLLAKLANFDLMLTFGNVVLGIVVSVVIGIVSGFMPAYSASQLDPVEAIRAK
jgi:putative ABC transport system permease protein